MSMTVEPEVIDELKTIETLEDNMALRAMVEYTFKTEDAYFSTTPAVEIISRKRTEITFRVPFGISQVSIAIKQTGL